MAVVYYILMRRIILTSLFLAALGAGAYYLVPPESKRTALAMFTNFIPLNGVEEKLAPFVRSPVDTRAKLLGQLKNDLDTLKKTDAAAGAVDPAAKARLATIAHTEELVQKLERANTDQSFLNKITTGVADKITGVIAPLSDPSTASPGSPQNCSR